MTENRAAGWRRVFFILLLAVAGYLPAAAQSTIFNIPSTDTQEKRTLYIEGDFIAHFDKWERGGFQSFGIRSVYGVNKKLEVGANYFYTRTGAIESPPPQELQFNVKYRIVSNDEDDTNAEGFQVSTGAQVFVPVTRAAGRRTYGMVYANASRLFKKTNGTRLTGGIYTVVGAESGFGTKTGALLGFEQPIKGELNFTADWFSGRNRFGYAAAGFSYTFAERHFLQIGYNWGNSGRGNNGLGVFYGYTF